MNEMLTNVLEELETFDRLIKENWADVFVKENGYRPEKWELDVYIRESMKSYWEDQCY
jgi:hypothetical protein